MFSPPPSATRRHTLAPLFCSLGVLGLVGEPRVGGVDGGLVDGPRREQAHHHRLGPLAGAPRPDVGDLGEVPLDVRGEQRPLRRVENPLMMASFTALGRSSSCTARCQARSLASAVGIRARACSACRCPVAVGSRSSSSSIVGPGRRGGAVRHQRLQQPPPQVGVDLQAVRHVDVEQPAAHPLEHRLGQHAAASALTTASWASGAGGAVSSRNRSASVSSGQPRSAPTARRRRTRSRSGPAAAAAGRPRSRSRRRTRRRRAR